MSNKIPSFTAGKAVFVFQMPFAETDHINKKIYLLEQDGCHPIYTPDARCDGFYQASFSGLVIDYKVWATIPEVLHTNIMMISFSITALF